MELLRADVHLLVMQLRLHDRALAQAEESEVGREKERESERGRERSPYGIITRLISSCLALFPSHTLLWHRPGSGQERAPRPRDRSCAAAQQSPSPLIRRDKKKRKKGRKEEGGEGGGEKKSLTTQRQLRENGDRITPHPRLHPCVQRHVLRSCTPRGVGSQRHHHRPRGAGLPP